MILEALRHILLPCPRPLKRLGVLRGLIALEQRERRCRAAWAPHRAAAQDVIRAAAQGLPKGGTAVILGSGLLLEVPLADLAGQFDRVVLVDLFHMPAVRRAAAVFGNVECVIHDLGGVLHALTESPLALPPPRPSLPPGTEDAALVVSANCLSQIPLDPMAAARSRADDGEQAEVMTWGRALIAGHLATLAACRGRVVLLTDIRRRVVHKRDGTVMEEDDLLLGVPLPILADRRTWRWSIAPAPEEYRHWNVEHEVVAGTLVVPHIHTTP